MQCRHDFRFPMQFISLFLSNRNIIVYRPAQQMLQRLFTLFHHHHHLNSIPEKRSLKYTKREYIKSEKCAAWLGIIGLDLISLLHLADVNSSQCPFINSYSTASARLLIATHWSASRSFFVATWFKLFSW